MCAATPACRSMRAGASRRADPFGRFVPLDSCNHLLLETEPASADFSREMHAFLAGGFDPATVTSGLSGLTRSEHEVLGLLARGLDNTTIAVRLGKREKTVRNQVTSILSKLQVRSPRRGHRAGQGRRHRRSCF